MHCLKAILNSACKTQLTHQGVVPPLGSGSPVWLWCSLRSYCAAGPEVRLSPIGFSPQAHAAALSGPWSGWKDPNCSSIRRSVPCISLSNKRHYYKHFDAHLFSSVISNSSWPFSFSSFACRLLQFSAVETASASRASYNSCIERR